MNLTATQQRVGEQLVESLNPHHGALALLEGLSGVGKTTLVNEFQDAIKGRNGLVLDYIWDYAKKVRGALRHKNVVMTVLPSERKSVEEHGLLGAVPTAHILPGMSLDEIVERIQHGENSSGLTFEQIGRYSLGIPLLAENLMGAVNLTRQEAPAIGAGYLSRHGFFDAEGCRAYLQIPVSRDVAVALRGGILFTKDVYFDIARTLFKRDELKAKGVFEESPFFVAPESREICKRMLSGRYNAIHVYAPDVKADDVDRIREAFTGSKIAGDFGYEEVTESPRVRMFSAELRKYGLRFSQYGRVYYHNSEWPNDLAEDAIVELMNEVKRIPSLKQKLKFGKNNFYMHKHDHDGHPHQTSVWAWMVESLLQQRGVTYFVDNRLAGMVYAYEPATRRII